MAMDISDLEGRLYKTVFDNLQSGIGEKSSDSYTAEMLKKQNEQWDKLATAISKIAKDIIEHIQSKAQLSEECDIAVNAPLNVAPTSPGSPTSTVPIPNVPVGKTVNLVSKIKIQ